nr:hypothetical protein [Ereboglobus luteus]
MRREVVDSGGAAREAVERGGEVGGEARGVEREVARDVVQVGVLRLENLVYPVQEFDVGVAAHFAEDGGAFECLIRERVEFAEEGGALDGWHGDGKC